MDSLGVPIPHWGFNLRSFARVAIDSLMIFDHREEEIGARQVCIVN